MTRSFGEAAVRLCSASATLLGWRPDEFWSATPAELACCLVGPDAGEEPIDSDAIAELRRRFPD